MRLRLGLPLLVGVLAVGHVAAWSCGTLMLVARTAESRLRDEGVWDHHMVELEQELREAARDGGLPLTDDIDPGHDAFHRTYGALMETACRSLDAAAPAEPKFGAAGTERDHTDKDVAALHRNAWYPWLMACVPSHAERASHPELARAPKQDPGVVEPPPRAEAKRDANDDPICRDARESFGLESVAAVGARLEVELKELGKLLARGYDKRSPKQLLRAFGDLASLVAAAHNPLQVCGRVHGSLQEQTIAVDRGGVESMPMKLAGSTAESDTVSARAIFDRLPGGGVAEALERARPIGSESGEGGDDNAELEDNVQLFVDNLITRVHPDALQHALAAAPPRKWIEESAEFCEAELYPVLHVRYEMDGPLKDHFQQLLAERVALAGARLALVLESIFTHRDKPDEVDFEL